MTDAIHNNEETSGAFASALSLQNYVVEKQCDIGIATDGGLRTILT